MSNETTNETTNESTDINLVGTFKEALAAKVAGLSVDLQSTLVDQLYSEKLKDIGDKLYKKWAEMVDLEKQISKLTKAGGDIKTFDENGKLLAQSFSEDKIKEIRKLKESYGKVKTSVEKAFSGDYSRLS